MIHAVAFIKACKPCALNACNLKPLISVLLLNNPLFLGFRLRLHPKLHSAARIHGLRAFFQINFAYSLRLEKFYERKRQEKSFPLTWQLEFFLTASPAILGVSCALGRQHSLSIEPVRTTTRLIPPSLPVNAASMATMVLFVTRSLWQFQVVRGGLTWRT
jgi:hypothetical protein